jgi:hypothetical protein
MPELTRERSEFEVWAEGELRRAGLFDEDSDYGGMMGESVMQLIEAFAGEGHSGFSAQMAAHLFGELSAYKPLTALTNSPDEWMHIDADMTGNATTWQSRRNPSAFSGDGGKTYTLLDERPSWPRRLARAVTGRHWPKKHRAAEA